MDRKNWIIISGILAMLLFLVSFWFSKSPLDLFFSTIGLIGIVIGFFVKDKKINISTGFITAIFGVNVIQWFILIYTFYNYPDYAKIVLSYYIVTIPVLMFIFYKNAKLSKESVLIDKTKSILLLTSIFVIIGCLAGFLVYFYYIFLWGATLGIIAFIYGFYHEGNKINVSVNYARAMCSLIILQFFILFYFIHQISKFDWTISLTLSGNIAILFAIQIYRSDLKISKILETPYTNDLKISNEKKEIILGICAIAIVIAIFAL